MHKTILLLILIATTFSSLAQKRAYVVVHTSKRYISARLTAEQASKVLNIPLDTRKLVEHSSIGLTLSRNECNTIDTVSYPFYPLRKQESDGVYISIEYSNAYPKWAKGYYLVIIASGNTNAPQIQSTLKKAKAYYKDAYLKLAY